MSFNDASGDLERSFLRGGENCCVTFRGKRDAVDAERRRQKGVMVILLIIAAMVIGTVWVASRRCTGKGCEIELEKS